MPFLGDKWNSFWHQTPPSRTATQNQAKLYHRDSLTLGPNYSAGKERELAAKLRAHSGFTNSNGTVLPAKHRLIQQGSGEREREKKRERERGREREREKERERERDRERERERKRERERQRDRERD